MLGMGTSLSTAAVALLTYVTDNLKIYFDFKSKRAKTLEFVGTGSCSFDGTNDKIDFGTDSELDITGESTYAFWIKFNEDADDMVYSRTSGSTNGVWIWLRTTGNKIEFDMADGSGVSATTSADDSITVGQWHHVVCTWNGTVGAVYIDGIDKTNLSVGRDCGTVSTNALMGEFRTGGYDLNGNVKNFAVWKRALSLSEAQNIMYKTYSDLKGTETTHLLCWFPLEESKSGETGKVVDSKGTVDDGTITGATIAAYGASDVYGLDTPRKPRGFDNAPTAQADLIGSGSVLIGGNTSDDFILVSEAFTGTDMSAAFTATAWVKLNYFSYETIWGDPGDLDSAKDDFLQLINSTTWRAETGGTSTGAITHGETLVVNRWYHLAWTRNGSNVMTLYIDGKATLNGPTTAGTFQPDGWGAGSDGAGGTETEVDGNICQAGFWSRQLSQEEIQSVKEKTYSEFTSGEKASILGYWGLDSTVGLNDEVGSNNATLHNGAALSEYGDTAANFNRAPQKTGEPLDHAKLYSGKALEFDGVADYLDTNYNAYTNSLEGSDLTLSCWLKYGSTTNDYATIWGTSNYGDRGFSIRGKSSTTISAGAGDDSSFEDVSFTFTAGLWHFAVATFTQSDLKTRFYVDGVLIGTSSALSGNIQFDQSWTIAERFLMGARVTSAPDHYWDGALSNCQVWNKVWSLSDVQYAYNNPETLITGNASVTAGITTSNLLVWYPMNDTGVRSPQTVIFDAAGTNNTTKNHATTTFWGDEEAVNGDFETFPTMHATNDDTWTGDDQDGSQQMTMVTEGTTVHAGSGSGKCALKFGSTDGYLTYNKTDYVVGRTYRAEVYMRKGDSQTMSAFQMFADDSIRGEDGTDGDAITPSDTFAIAYVEFVAAATTMMINCKFTGTATHFGFIDAFSIKEKGIASGWTDADQQQTIPQTALMNGSSKLLSPIATSTAHYTLDSTGTTTSGTAYSVSAWLMRTVTPSGTDVYLLGTGTSNDRIYFPSATQVAWLTDGTGTTIDLGITVAKNVWDFWTFVSDGGTYRVYRNATQLATSSQSPSNGLDYNHIGIWGAVEASTAFEGIIDELAIWDTNLSAAEVTELYNSGAPLDAQTHSEKDNLKAYWRNNRLTSAGKMEDIEGSNDATLSNSSSFETVFFQEGITSGKDSQGVTTNITHPSGGAVYFGGVSDYVDLGKTTTIEGEFTLEFWLKTDNPGTTANTIMGTGADDKLIITDNNTLTLEMAGTDEVLDINDVGNHATDTLLINEWVHIAITRNSSDAITMYVNATAQSDTESSTVGFDYRYIGFDGESTYFKGWLDEFKVYDKELTSGQVKKNYNHGKSKHSN